MKIAIVRQRYNPFGGAERFVERALEALAKEGAEVSLITRDWAGAPQAGFRQITCNPSYSRPLGGRAARDRSFAACVQQQFAAGDFDITQSHERIPGCMIFRAGDGVHAAWLEHRSRILSPLQRLAQVLSPYHRYVLAAEREMFAHPALKAVICNSPMVAAEVAYFYGVDRSKLSVIYNGVDTQLFHPEALGKWRASMRESAGIPARVPLLLFVGSGFERKGVPQLLQAFSRMRNGQARLVVVGADRKLAAMRRLAAGLGLGERVTFTGPLQDVRPWYGAADALVLPTLYDPCPNAALEALACGLPILTSTTCGAKVWVSEGVNGFTVDALDIEKMACSLDELCELTKQPESHVASRQAVQDLSLSAMADRLLELYRTSAAT